jgi:hypothetical protein
MARHPLVRFLALAAAVSLSVACGDDDSTATPRDPLTAERAMVDRFSAQAGTLMVRTATNGLPGPNQPIDFDSGPFVTQGFGPGGEVVRYYNFDIQSRTPAPIFVFFRPGATAPLAGQLNVIDVLPGETGYNDFWRVVKVTVPDDYVANTVTSLAGITAAGFTTEMTDDIVNCPVVPEGSTAALRLGGGATGLMRGWVKDRVVSYFSFEEKALALENAMVPISPIYVTFNVNPDASNPDSGPPSGFVTEAGSAQTHNVLATLPSSAGYSPLWAVQIYDNADFAGVDDLASATAASRLADNAALVNCPVVSVQAP